MKRRVHMTIKLTELRKNALREYKKDDDGWGVALDRLLGIYKEPIKLERDWRRMKQGETMNLKFDSFSEYLEKFKAPFNLHTIRHTKKEFTDMSHQCPTTDKITVELIRLK